ncbi:MAG: hypothetical protein HKN27_00320 [Silicimonas sp.]|nr:hypothetical protein [Silicimonas sp.]
MHYVQAVISLGLFGWFGYAVAFDAVPGGDGGSSKTRALQSVADTLTYQMGAAPAGAAIAGAGVLLAAYFLARGR